jgi:hypothetical protein
MPAEIPPMTPERWLANLFEVSREIADQEKQESRWIASDRYPWENPGELFCSLFDDCVFELFIEKYADTFSAEQSKAIVSFRESMNRWNESTAPGFADPVKALQDPDWANAQISARAFESAFEGKWPATPVG